MPSNRTFGAHRSILPTDPGAPHPAAHPLYDTLDETSCVGQEGAAERDEQEERESILREAYRIEGAYHARIILWISQRR